VEKLQREQHYRWEGLGEKGRQERKITPLVVVGGRAKEKEVKTNDSRQKTGKGVKALSLDRILSKRLGGKNLLKKGGAHSKKKGGLKDSLRGGPPRR